MGDVTHSILANMSKVTGRHSLRFGVDVRFNLVNYGQLGTPSGTFNFERVMTQGPDPRASTANARCRLCVVPSGRRKQWSLRSGRRQYHSPDSPGEREQILRCVYSG